MSTTIFLHGLDSSSRGTKGSYFKHLMPDMLMPDFSGPLAVRLQVLEEVLRGKDSIKMIGSSFGGLMAAIYAMHHQEKLTRIILLAPALNFKELDSYEQRVVHTPTLLVIGKRDVVTPPDEVVVRAKEIFIDLEIRQTDDDHLLRRTFPDIDWRQVLA